MNYANGKIYCIRSYQTNDIYIGSTVQPLCKRLYRHKTDYKYYLNNKHHYISSFEIIKFEDAYIELIENYSCSNKDELRKKEGEHIRNTLCINKRIENRTKKEWYEDNKDKILDRVKEYQQQHKDKIREYMFQYGQKNKEKLKEQKRHYIQDNKDQLYKKYDCICGGKFTHNHKLKHLKTKIHQKFILSSNNIDADQLRPN